MSYLFAFSSCSWSSQGKNAEVSCHSLLHWTNFVRPLHCDPSVLGGPTRHGLVHCIRQGLVHSLRVWSRFSEKTKRVRTAGSQAKTACRAGGGECLRLLLRLSVWACRAGGAGPLLEGRAPGTMTCAGQRGSPGHVGFSSPWCALCVNTSSY